MPSVDTNLLPKSRNEGQQLLQVAGGNADYGERERLTFFFGRSASFRAASSDFYRLRTSKEVISKQKKVITNLADARDTSRRRLNYT